MFITERYSLQNGANQAGNRDWPDGMRLVKSKAVRRGLSYRSIILVAGIGVALIVILTLWASRKGEPLAISNPVTTVLSQASDIAFIKDLVKRDVSF
ncbi:MAG: hypothetical protein QM762_05770 [Chryseolinea sp.]